MAGLNEQLQLIRRIADAAPDAEGEVEYSEEVEDAWGNINSPSIQQDTYAAAQGVAIDAVGIISLKHAPNVGDRIRWQEQEYDIVRVVNTLPAVNLYRVWLARREPHGDVE